MKRTKPLRRKGIPKRPRRGERGSLRMAILHRARGLCEYCGEAISSNSWEDHHIFFRSQTAKLVVDQIWNRCALHDRCHALVHREAVARRALELLALRRLEWHVGPFLWAQLQEERNGTAPSALILAYERHSRRTLADVVGADAAENPTENPTDTSAKKAV